jgi:polysaccharide pyruvyl transferase WcaK-like protein
VYDASVYPYVNDRPVHERVVPELENWLAAFADAEFVVTDSFHGCVLSLLLHKRFIAVGNSRRGMARLSSLLNMFGLDMRLVHGIDPEDDGVYFLSDIDWEEVDRVIARKREESFDFLRKALER